jgi:hypothetical protein
MVDILHAVRAEYYTGTLNFGMKTHPHNHCFGMKNPLTSLTSRE